MDIRLTISQIQQQVDLKMRSQQSHNYQNTIVPAAKDILNILKDTDMEKWPTHSNIANDIDIYIEALSIYVIYNYSKNINISYTPHVMMLVLLKHPYFINVFVVGKNREEWDKSASRILDNYVSTFGKNVTLDNKYNLKRLLSEPVAFGKSMTNKSLSERSGLSRLNYMLGFHYLDDEQGILKDEVINHVSEMFNAKDATNYIYIVVNISHNVENTDSIIIYKNVRKNMARILSVERVQQFDAFINPDVIHKAKCPLTFLDNNFKQIEQIDDSVEYGIVLLSFNDSSDMDSCHFIIARYGEDSFLNQQEMNDFINFRVMKFMDAKLLEIDLMESFYIICNKQSRDLQDLKRQYIQLATYTKNVFEESTKETFIDNFIKNIASVSIIHQSEIPYLKMYLHGIYLLKIYDKDAVITYVSDYIYPDLITKGMI